MKAKYQLIGNGSPTSDRLTEEHIPNLVKGDSSNFFTKEFC